MTKTHSFAADVKQMLDIVVHSLYTDKEVFIRELVSNASDALEKLRHLQLSGNTILDDNLPLEINIQTDDQAGTLTIQDFGIGMDEAALIENLGTIAHSGSKAFVAALKEGGNAAENLIGQFGVGFYSAFMVAESVQVYTRSWEPESKGYLWESSGTGEYTIEEVEGQRRGTKIVVKLKEDQKDFSKPETVKSIVKRYSSFVQHPLNINGEKQNTVQAIWLRNKNEIKEEEYREFYKFQADAFDEPRFWLHFSSDAPINLNALLFVPTENPERYGLGRTESDIALYCKKVLIDDSPQTLLPEWMRFVKGIVDSADIPLNISRESMQDSQLLQKIGKVLTGRFIKFLQEKRTKETESYDAFWKDFGHYIKEGVTTDWSNREALGKLLRYETSLTEPGKFSSFDEIAGRMKEEQKEIYYLLGSSREAIEAGPYIEAFKANSIEVVYLFEGVDEFVMSHLREFDQKKLVSADQEGLNLESVLPKPDAVKMSDAESSDLCEWLKATFGSRLSDVKPSQRLVENPAVVLSKDRIMSANMRRIMKAMHQSVPNEIPVQLEINPAHPLMHSLLKLKVENEELARMVAEQIVDNCMLNAGLLDDTRVMVNRIYNLLEKVK